MLYDASASNTLFADGRPPTEDLPAILAGAREQLGLNGVRPWRLLSGRRKMGKTLFEIEESTSAGPRRLIGKICKPERTKVLYEALDALRRHGFRPPARHTVTEPVAILPEQGFILQERAPGKQGRPMLLEDGAAATKASIDSAEWLATLHATPVLADPGVDKSDAIAGWARELSDVLHGDRVLIARIEDAVLREIAEPVNHTVPTHGDFHPLNIFIDGEERITGIDLDKFALREPEFDIGNFIAQTACFSYFDTGAMETTLEARRSFLKRYEETSGRAIRVRRAALYVATTLLKNLHFELVLLKTGRTERASPWLSAAAEAILNENLDLTR